MILRQVLKQIHDTKALSYDTCFIIKYIGNWLNCGHRILYIQWSQSRKIFIALTGRVVGAWEHDIILLNDDIFNNMSQQDEFYHSQFNFSRISLVTTSYLYT